MSLYADSHVFGISGTSVGALRRKRNFGQMTNEHCGDVKTSRTMEDDMSPPTKKSNLSSTLKNEQKVADVRFLDTLAKSERETKKAIPQRAHRSVPLIIGHKRKYMFSESDNDINTLFCESMPTHCKCPKLSYDQLSPHQLEQKEGEAKLPAKPQLWCDDEKKNDDATSFFSSSQSSSVTSSSLSSSSLSSSSSPSSSCSSLALSPWEQSDLLKQLNVEEGSRKRLVIPKDAYGKRSLLQVLLGTPEPLNSKNGALVKYQDPMTTMFRVSCTHDRDGDGVDSNCKNINNHSTLKQYRCSNPINPFQGGFPFFKCTKSERWRVNDNANADEQKNNHDIQMEDSKINSTLDSIQTMSSGQDKVASYRVPKHASSKGDFMDID
ncbi:hypothetical protein RFI_26441 [Reticulomyxa filosa]|uniref:Uncharacterized protein n=1 Tax=Reticulomyxa filosa TaxID=46433 RepID=X6MAR4_RETFI|nr:hypothetical protein RFI_26441 [Reticulomyxa filosa]|eukprot:ETO10934.1 hypothetical protein RFI_26441 [Reticulomyxa filosa]